MQIEINDFEVMDLLRDKISDLKLDIQYGDNVSTWKEQMAKIKSLTRAVEVFVNKLHEPAEEEEE